MKKTASGAKKLYSSAKNTRIVKKISQTTKKKTPKKVSKNTNQKRVDSAHNAAQAAKLKEHYKQSQKYGKAGVKELENGRIRYYGNITPASKPGEMAGRRVVREWNPSNGKKRTWHETVDHKGKVRLDKLDLMSNILVDQRLIINSIKKETIPEGGKK